MIYVYAFLFFVVALIYSAAGFGGGSMYLVILAQSTLSVESLRMAALSCNAIVTANGTWRFHKANWIVWKGVLALLMCSLPPCLYASSLQLTEKTYFLSLALALLVAGIIMLMRPAKTDQLTVSPLRWWMYPLAFIIGAVSGVTGIGGGIYLAPFLYLSKWGSPKQIAGASSVFILVNSLAGLSMQIASHGWLFDWTVIALFTAVFIGGLLGSYWSSARFTHRFVRWITVVVIIFAAIRMLVKYL